MSRANKAWLSLLQDPSRHWGQESRVEPVPLCASSLPEAAFCPTQLLCYLGPVVQSLDRLLRDWELNVVAYAMPVSLRCSRNGEGLQGTPF